MKTATGGPWGRRDVLSFVQKTHQERDVADFSQTHPIASFAQKVPGTCRADEALAWSLNSSTEHFVWQLQARMSSAGQQPGQLCLERLVSVLECPSKRKGNRPSMVPDADCFVLRPI
jgi:hypothetical protein